MMESVFYTVGDFAEISHVVTENEINEFAKLSGDNNLLHVSQEYASSKGRRGVVSHGVLTMSLISRIIGTRLPGDGALWVSQSTQFSGAVYAGDRLTGQVKITKFFAKDLIIDVETSVVNQNNKSVLRGTGRVKLPIEKRESPSISASSRDKYPVLILGGSSSVGLHLTKHLTEKGFDVTSTFSHHPDQLEQLITEAKLAGLSGRAIHFDIKFKQNFFKSMDQLYENGVRPVSLINCLASEPTNVLFQSTEFESSGSTIGFESEALLAGTSLLLKEMRERQFGRIINIGSSARGISPEPGWLAYVASKQAAFSVIRSLAVELGPLGVTANSVAPGLLGVGMTREISERTLNNARIQTPTRRLASIESVCHAVSFLLSETACDINGQEIVVDGGRI